VSIPSGPGGIFPLPNAWLQDNAYPPQLNDLARRIQENMEKLQVGVGANSNTVASVGLTGLYAGTWTGYTGTAGFTPYYTKRSGIVAMGGAVTNGGNFIAGQTMLTMPAGFRPASTEQFSCIAVGGGPTTGIAIVQVAATGVMTFISGITGGGLANPMTYISLSDITYGAAA
jgi:hypothetical protein